MGARRIAAYVALCCVSLAGCRGEEAEVTPAAKVVASAPALPSADRSTVVAKVHATLPTFTFTVVGQKSAANVDTLQVTRIEVRRGDETSPHQIIDQLDTETPRSEIMLDVIDMNFDGYGDIRIVQSRPAGPNVPYLNWLFDPASGKFVASPALNDIVAPQYDAASREIHSSWRDGPTRYGKDVYVYRDGSLLLLRKEVREYSAPKTYTLIRSELVDGRWKTVEKREVQEP